MLKFYYNPISVNARRVWVPLLEKQIPFELILVNLDRDQFDDDFTAINPLQRIPASIANGRYTIEQVVPYPDFVGEQPGDVDDIALVKLNSPVNQVATFDLYEDEAELGQEVLLLGRGDYGNSQIGTIGTDKKLRKATNLIDKVDDHWIKFRFDAPPDCTLLEGVSGIGDSGSPALIDKYGKLLIAGVSSWQNHEDEAYGLYEAVEYYTRVSRYITWIRSVCER